MPSPLPIERRALAPTPPSVQPLPAASMRCSCRSPSAAIDIAVEAVEGNLDMLDDTLLLPNGVCSRSSGSWTSYTCGPTSAPRRSKVAA